MRKSQAQAVMAAFVAAASSLPAFAQDSFDACDVFTQADAQKVLATTALAEAVNPKAKRARVVANCTYTGTKDGKAVAATAQFRFGRSPEEANRAFDEARLKLQTKPMLISGADAFWAGKAGEMHLRKGRTWLTLAVGSATVTERDLDQARRLAEILVKKL